MDESSSSAAVPALADNHLKFLDAQRVAHLATADAHGRPHVVPVCFAVSGNTIYITIDDKPKRAHSASLKRIRNITENPAVAFVADHYDDEDWSRLGWVMVRGNAEILNTGSEHAAAQKLLRNRYSQMETMALEQHPVVAIRIDWVTSWGNLLPPPQADGRQARYSEPEEVNARLRDELKTAHSAGWGPPTVDME